MIWANILIIKHVHVIIVLLIVRYARVIRRATYARMDIFIVTRLRCVSNVGSIVIDASRWYNVNYVWMDSI